jgi:hypothetical protein
MKNWMVSYIIKTVTQFEMGILEKLKMLKVDFLGLATLSIMARACDLIKERHGIEYNLNNIPLDDPEVYKFLGDGNTLGVFQLEGSGMTKWLVQMKPTGLDNIIAMVALFRPGPMEFIPDYISRMHGETEVEYRHPLLEPILKSTYGITVYQEQIMYTAINLAGYTASEADNLRKSVAKKKADDLLAHRTKFVEGAAQRGVTKEIANLIFDDWEAFARYGFPMKSPEDADRLRNHVIAMFQQAAESNDPARRRRLLTFVMVGAGYTGQETVTELHDLIHASLLRDYPTIRPEEIRILLVDGHPDLPVPPHRGLASRALRVLQRNGVEVRFSTRAKDAGPGWVEFTSGERIDTDTLIWAAGVQANPIAATLPGPKGSMGRLPVLPTLQLPD